MFYDWAAGRYDRNAWSALTRVNERCVGHGSGHAGDLANCRNEPPIRSCARWCYRGTVGLGSRVTDAVVA
jgi:hypothetical protein